MKSYKSAALGFAIHYPETWEALPAPWAKQFSGRAKATSSKLAEILEQARSPFLVIHDPNISRGLAIPCVKCQTHRLSALTASGGIGSILSSTERLLKEAFPDYETLEFVPECLVAGVIGARLVSAMSVSNLEGASFHAISEMLFLPSPRYLFTVGLSATSDASFRPVAEFVDITRSIRLT